MRREFTDRACSFWLDPEDETPSALPELHVMVDLNGKARIGIDQDQDGQIRWVDVSAQQLADISYQLDRLSGVAGQLRLAWEAKNRVGPATEGQTFTSPDGTVRPLGGGDS